MAESCEGVVLPSRGGHDDEDNCSVCLEPPTEPRALPCRHVFCTKCLQGLLDDVKEEGAEYLVCPNCRDETAPPASVEELRFDYATQKSVECRSFCVTAAKQTEEPCKCCGKRDTADKEPAAYCSDCGGGQGCGICHDCVQLHLSHMHFREHKFVDWKYFSVDTLKLKPLRKCPSHKLEIQLFCEQCKLFACSICLKERHKTHLDDTKPLEEVSEKRLAEVKQLRENAEKSLAACDKQLEGLQEIENGLAYYPNNLEQSIVSAFDEYMQKLSTWREQILTEAREKYSKLSKTISGQYTDTTNAKIKLNAGIELAHKAVSCTNSAEIIEMSGRAIEQLKQTMETCAISPLERPLAFERGELSLGKLRDIEEGDIQVKLPDYWIVTEKNKIKVCFMLPVYTTPVIKVLYGSQKQRSLILHPSKPAVDSCTVDCIPRCAGKHSIEVWVGGVMCRRCNDVMVVHGAPDPTSKVKPGPDWHGDADVTTGAVLSAEQLEQCRRPFHMLKDDEDESFEVKVQWNTGEEVKYKWGNDAECEIELDL